MACLASNSWLEMYLGARIDAEVLDAELSNDELNREEPTPSEKHTAYLHSVGPKWIIAAASAQVPFPQLIARCRRLPMNADALLQHAAAVVLDRRRLYGEPLQLFEQVATRWSLVIGVKITPVQAMLCLIDLKTARLTHDTRHLDSITDIAGYAGCLAEVLSDA